MHSEADLLRHYTLSDEDLQNIGLRRRPRNKLGFALQLCVLRYPGRLLAPGEFVPPAVVDFIGRQLHLDGEELGDYAVRSETRHEHLAELRRLYGFRSFSGGAARELVERLREEAPQAQSNEDLVREVRRGLPAHADHPAGHDDDRTSLRRRARRRGTPGRSPHRRAGAARTAARPRASARGDGRRWRDAVRLAPAVRAGQQFGRRQPAAGAPRASPAPRGSGRALRRHPSASGHAAAPAGERYFADGLRELPDNRRLAILAACAAEWETFVADAVVETHDRIVGRTYREAARTSEAQLGDETTAVREALRAFAELGTALIGARGTGAALDAVIADRPGWEGLGDLVSRAAALANTAASDPLGHVLGGYSRFRRYTPHRLRMLDIEASPMAQPLLEAVDVLRSDGTARPTGFLRPNSKWSRRLRAHSDPRLWETAVLFHLRDAFRAGDVWLARSRRYGDIRRTLLSVPAVADRSLPVPASPRDWLAERPARPGRRSAPAGRQGAGRCGRGRQHRRPHPPRRQDGGRRAGRGR